MPLKQPLTATMEDYLEMVYFLREENGDVLVSDIAKRLNVKSPSVHSAIKVLVGKGLVTHARYDYVGLTKEGEAQAQGIIKKHEILIRFLTEFLGMDKGKARTEACAIEHVISDETFQGLRHLFDHVGASVDVQRSDFLKKLQASFKTRK